MRKLFLLSIFLSFYGCSIHTNPEGVKFFASIHLNQLDLAHIDNFWNEGIDIDTSYYMGANFENHAGFIEGIKLYSGNGKAIWISVFRTKEDAVNAMELRISDVACVINKGDPDEFENQWWYSECMDYLIFENQYNTIVEIDFSSNATFDLIKNILLDVAVEINARIDKLSFYVN